VLLAALLFLVGRLVFGPRISQGETPLLRITVSGSLHSETPLNQQGEIVLQQPDGARNIVRYFPGEVTGKYLRITIGTPEENDRLLELISRKYPC
jgi:hypothetical protein